MLCIFSGVGMVGVRGEIDGCLLGDVVVLWEENENL